MAVMFMEWIAILVIVIVLLVIICIVALWLRYRNARPRNRRPTREPLPKEDRISAEQQDCMEILKSIRTDGEENIYVNAHSGENPYENYSFNEGFSKRPNVSDPSDMNPLLSHSQHGVTVTENVNKRKVHENKNVFEKTSQRNVQNPMSHTSHYNFKVTTPAHNISNVRTSHTVTSKRNLAVVSESGIQTIHSSRTNSGNNMSSAVLNKSAEFLPKHNNILKISWDFQNDKNTSIVSSRSLPGEGQRRSRANSLPSKVIIDKNKSSPRLHQKITLELSTDSNPDVLYDTPRRTTLSSEHKRHFKSANNESNRNSSDDRSSENVVYENVIIVKTV